MPIVCKISLDTAEYTAELDNVLKATEKAQASVASQASDAARAVSRAADQSAKAVEKAAKAPLKIAKPVETAVSGVEKSLAGSSAAASGSVDRIKESFSGLNASAASTGETLKAAIGKVAGFGSAVGIIAAGIASVIKIVKALAVDLPMRKLQDKAKEAAASFESIRDASAAAEEQRKKTDAAASSLAEYAGREKLANLERDKAARLIKQMSQGYGDLGLRIDEATGKLEGYTKAMETKLRKDRESRLQELTRQRDSATAAINYWDDVIGSNWTNNAEITNNAQAEKMKLRAEVDNLIARIGELKRSDPVGDYYAERAAQRAEKERDLEKSEKQFAQKKKDDSFESSLTGSSARLQASFLTDRVREEEEAVAGLKAWIEDHSGNRLPGDRADRADALDELLKKRSELLAAQEKLYESQKRLTRTEIEAEKQVFQFVDAKKQALELARLEADAEYARADALRLEQEIRTANLSLTEKELDEVRRLGKEQNALALETSFRDKARDLLDSAREKLGYGENVAADRAVRDAEKLKRGKLDSHEESMIRQLAALTHQLNNPGDLGKPDFSIRTNSLTARGGFASGAVAPDPEQVQRSTLEEVRRAAKIQERIETLLKEGLST